TVWTIPLSYYKNFDNKDITLAFVSEASQDLEVLVDPSANGLIKFNVDSRGMYIINYPEEDWDKWTDALQNNAAVLAALTPGDRANFLLDAYLLSKANYLSYVRPLQLAQYLVKEEHLTPWTVALESLRQIQKYMFTTDKRTQLMESLVKLGQPVFEKLGWDDTGSDTEKRLRTSIIEFVCSQYHKPCLEKALEEYKKFKSDTKLRPNLLTPTLRYAMRQSSDTNDWDFLWSKYLSENSSTVKQTYFNALSYTTNPTTIKTLLDRSLDSKLVKTQDMVTLVNNLGANWDALQILWEYFKENHSKFQQKLSTIQLGSVFNNICSYFTNTTRKQ
ncbi:unnamed protein product, partial [Oppiella nova]